MLNNEDEEEDSFKDTHLPALIKDYDSKVDLYLLVKLNSLIKVEDWFKDGTTMVKTLRSGGKGRSPYSDSTIKLRMQVEVNGDQIYTNYPAEAAEDFDNLRAMTPEARKEFLEAPEILTIRIDDY